MPEMQAARCLPMTEADLDRIMSIEASLHASPWTKGNFIDSLKAGHDARVMWIADEMVAYAVVLYIMDEAHLLTIGVTRNWQRQGIGVLFLNRLIEDAEAFGVKVMFLEVRASNIAAQHLYRKLGFLPVGERKNYYSLVQGGRENAIVMRLDFD